MELQGWTGAAAASIVGCAYSTVDQWDRVGVVRPSGRASGPGSRRRYSFQDLLALSVAAEVLRIGVPRVVAQRMAALVAERRRSATPHRASESSNVWIVCDGKTAWEMPEGRALALPRGSTATAVYAVPLRPIVAALCARIANPPTSRRRRRSATTRS